MSVLRRAVGPDQGDGLGRNFGIDEQIAHGGYRHAAVHYLHLGVDALPDQTATCSSILAWRSPSSAYSGNAP